MTIEELMQEYTDKNPASKQMWKDAAACIPGGISANVKFYSPFPLFMKHGEGACLTDVDGHRYIDYSLSYGPLILGHGRKEIKDAMKKHLDEQGTILFGPPHEGEMELAEIIKKHCPSIEMLRYTNSGTEATLLAIRIAMAYTEKYKIAKFEGHYHGGHNDVLVSVNPNVKKAGDASHPTGLPASRGISEEQLARTIILPFNDLDACREILTPMRDEVACVIMEPLQGGTIPATQDFMDGLRELTAQLGILLIFDEVKTGFRVGMSGAQGYYKIKPDLTTLGKVLGGGLPIGVLGGKKEIMELANPDRISFFSADKSIDRATEILFHSGTYNGNPLILRIGMETVKILEKEMESLFDRTEILKERIRSFFEEKGIHVLMPGMGAMFNICITDQKELLNYRDVKKCDFGIRRRMDYALMLEGVYNKPCTRYHTSTAHTMDVIDETMEAYERAFRRL